MDKFASDLDKALDEYEFKDAERLPPVPTSAQIGVPTMSGTYHQVPLSSGQAEASNIMSGTSTRSDELNRDYLTSNIDSLRKAGVEDEFDSINHFYTHDGFYSDKLQHKPAMNVESTDSSSLTIHNDISQKLLQKRLNDNMNNQSTYDIKLTQPNLNPSVSSVFHNFNSYMNVPTTGNYPAHETCNKPQDIYQTRSNEGLTVTNKDAFKSNFMTNSEIAPKFSIDDLLTVKDEDLILERKDNMLPPKYQNILLPVKVGPSIAEKSAASSAVGPQEKVEFPDLITGDNYDADHSNKGAKSLLDEPEPVYENVYIGTDIPKNHENSNAVNVEVSHSYENVGTLPQDLAQLPTNKSQVHEIVHAEYDKKFSETERTARKMSEQFMDEDFEFHIKPDDVHTNLPVIVGTSSNLNLDTKLVFQNVQLNPPQSQIPAPKHCVGFTNIDDMSEEELNKYLADLEAEDRENESRFSLYQNVQANEKVKKHSVISLSIQQEDEDANEAPIFEAVTIGELPQVPQEDLQEKAKKFPIIDYSHANISRESMKDATCSVPETNVMSAQIIEEEDKSISSKKTNEIVNKSSDMAEPTFLNSTLKKETNVDEKDEENGNVVSMTESADIENQLGNLENKLEGNENDTESNTSLLDNVVNEDSINSDQNKTTKTPVRSTETISRFSVTRNVDVNDKLGGRSSGPLKKPIKIKKVENLTEQAESSDDDPNKPGRPQSLDVGSSLTMSDTSSAGASISQETSDVEAEGGRAPSPDISESNSSMESGTTLGKQPPFWIPDSDAPNCMLCEIKFTVMKRRHHCRACGKVLCSKCCNMKYRLEYQSNVESRVCVQCHQLLSKAESDSGSGDYVGFSTASNAGINSPMGRPPNPNNPMEYCSTIPPLQQLAGALPPPPTVMVPVGVLKREGSSKQRSEGTKSVMFSDGIRPGCDLTELDLTWDWRPPSARKLTNRRVAGDYVASSAKKQNCPPLDPITNSYIPSDISVLPPTVTIFKGEVTYNEITDVGSLYASLKNECEPPVLLAINRNLYAYVKIINLSCCVNKICWNITSKGLACVGQDEVVFLVETLPDENEIPKDLLLHINQIYYEAIKGNTLSEYGMSIHQGGNLLGSREHAGFLFIRQTLQCLQKVIVPPAPFLVGLLVHRWETPWAKVFPLRLVLRLGAEYRYYPCPLMSVRFRDAVYFEIGHTIMKLLADFRNFAYTLPKVQGMTIHMQDRTTSVRFPKNRYNQVIQGLNNSNDHVLAFAANFSIQADTHLVCMQTNSEEESTYQTQAINIQNKPRKVTGASFIVINGALKSSMGLSANSSILEDGLMVQIMPEKMEALKAALKNMQDFTIGCGRQGAPEPDEIVNIKWVENDMQFNIGVKSPIDGKPMDGIPSIRVHNGVNFVGTNRFIRWTEVFIIKSDDDHPFGMQYPVDINKLSESIARATCAALVKLLDLLANAGLTKIAVRISIHPDNVGYEAGSEGTRLPPIYMNSLDNELIQVLQKAVQGCEDTQTVLELIFYVLETEI